MRDGQGPANAYNCLAPGYDEFTRANDYEQWLGGLLLPALERHGLSPVDRRALDIGCGTGRAFAPLLNRDWEIVGCDVSAGMLDVADHAAAGAPVVLVEADVRALPRFPGAPFDLIIALNDVINYLVDDGDLERAFAGVKRNLAVNGFFCFDANTLALFEGSFVGGRSEWMSGGDWLWRGLSPEAVSGAVHEAEVSGPGVRAHTHRQRHWPRTTVVSALKAAGLQLLSVVGQREEEGRIVFEDSVDERRHYKTIYVLGHMS